MKIIGNVLCFFIVGCSYNAPDSVNIAIPMVQFEHEKLVEEKIDSATKKLRDSSLPKVDEEIKPAETEHTSHLQEETLIGNVKAIIHNFCTPMLNDCESSVVLKYRNQTLKTKIPWFIPYPAHLSKKEISQNGKFIVIESSSGGNCADCSGIYAFELENEEILSLGYFSEIENGFLVIGYTDLEQNGLTSHADAPFWWLYYTEDKGQITLDTDKTCNKSKNNVNYSEKKNALLGIINSKKDKKRKNNNEHAYGEVESLILSVLSFAKWCGWEKESVDMATRIKEANVLTDYDKIQLLNKELNTVKKWDDSNTLKVIKAGNI